LKKHHSHIALVLCLLALPVSAPARDLGEITNYFQNVVVGPDDTAQEVVCIFCSVHASGNVSSDLVAIGGDIEISRKVDGGAEWLPTRLRRRVTGIESSKPVVP